MQTIVTHAHCVDGFVSELVLRMCYPNARVVRATYEDVKKLEVAPEVIFCDIAPPLGRAASFFAEGALILDHHKSAIDVFNLSDARGTYAAEPGVSGAVLAYRHLLERHLDNSLPYTPSPEVLERVRDITRLVGLYDTWIDTDPSFELACAAHAILDVFKSNADSLTLPAIVEHWPVNLEIGKLLFSRHKSQARDVAARAVRKKVVLGGADVVVGCIVDTPSTAVLNLAASLVEDVDVVLSASFDRAVVASDDPATIENASAGQLRASLRARHGSGVDCARLAQALGGGGHRGAAGFSCDRDSLPRPVQVALAALARIA